MHQPRRKPSGVEAESSRLHQVTLSRDTDLQIEVFLRVVGRPYGAHTCMSVCGKPKVNVGTVEEPLEPR